jgi:hypothetical protein
MLWKQSNGKDELAGFDDLEHYVFPVAFGRVTDYTWMEGYFLLLLPFSPTKLGLMFSHYYGSIRRSIYVILFPIGMACN